MVKRDNFYDCIRALAIALVVCTHYRGWIPGGSIGVSVFFCLSGLLICGILLRLPEVSAANIVKFIFRRFMRVWPLMAFQVLLLLAVLYVLRPEAVPDYLPFIPRLLAFADGYGVWVGLSPALLWSLRAEFWFYVLFAAAFYFAGRRHLVAIIVVGIGASWIAKFWLGHLSGRFWLVYLDQLMFGVACALIIHARPPWLRHFRSRSLIPAGLAAIALLACIPFARYDWVWYAQTSAAALCAAALLLHHAANPVRGAFEPTATLGRSSYSIYLMHGIVLDTVTSNHIVNPQFDALLIFSLIVGISLLTYRWIELPFIALSKRIAPFRRQAGPVEAAAAIPG